MREIKFRAWDNNRKEIIPFESIVSPLRSINNLSEYGWELMQCTGLKDKNGTEIYEGDKVCAPYVDCIFGDMVSNVIDKDFQWVVIYKNGCFCVENEDRVVYLHSFSKDGNIEVIGNIYENPELLK